MTGRRRHPTRNEAALRELVVEAIESVRAGFTRGEGMRFTLFAYHPDNPELSFLVTEDPDPPAGLAVCLRGQGVDTGGTSLRVEVSR